jgi:hypothetical protein
LPSRAVSAARGVTARCAIFKSNTRKCAAHNAGPVVPFGEASRCIASKISTISCGAAI